MKSIPQEDLDRGRDLFGRAIEVGTKVRSHDFAFGLKGRTLPLGMQTEGDRASYVEGVVEAIGDITIEGCPRYTIRPFVRVRAGEAESAEGDECIHPPVNGTPSLMGGVTCGVEVIEVYDEWDHAGGRTWYATLPETELSHFWTPECPSISEESDGFWLRSEEGRGGDRFDSLQEAKDSVFWEVSLDRHTQKERLEAEADLGPGWSIDLSDGISFIKRAGDGEEMITGCMSSDRPTWNAWTDAGQVPGDHQTPKDALRALDNWKTSRTRNAA